jgi:hypothetical protein
VGYIGKQNKARKCQLSTDKFIMKGNWICLINKVIKIIGEAEGRRMNRELRKHWPSEMHFEWSFRNNIFSEVLVPNCKSYNRIYKTRIPLFYTWRTNHKTRYIYFYLHLYSVTWTKIISQQNS